MKLLFMLVFVLSLFLDKTTFAERPFSTSQINIQNQQHSFKVIQSSFDVADNHLLAILKNNQSTSLVSEGKVVNTNTLLQEKNRIFKLLSPAQLQLKMKDIVFNIDTTMQKGSCTVVTVVRSEI